MTTWKLSSRATPFAPARRNGLLVGAPLLLGAAGVGLFLVVTQGLSTEVGHGWIADDGAVQTLTFAILVGSSVLAGVLALRHPAERTNLGLTALMLIVYAAREFDLHEAAWMPKDFTKLDLYSAEGVPLWQKFGCGLLMLSIIVVAISLAVRIMPRVLPDLKARKVWMVFAGLWLCVSVASQISDHSEFNEIFAGQAFEEIAECVAAGFVVLAVYFFPRADRWGVDSRADESQQTAGPPDASHFGKGTKSRGDEPAAQVRARMSA
jgi:hypothetical protein